MRRISRNQADDPQKAGVRIATMYRIKEGEFKVVFISALDADSFPLVNEADDAPQRKVWLNQEKALFYVAASRATDLLFSQQTVSGVYSCTVLLPISPTIEDGCDEYLTLI